MGRDRSCFSLHRIFMMLMLAANYYCAPVVFSILGSAFFTSCTKEGDTIYQLDPKDQADNAPLVMVVYDPNALGDRGYNDLIYNGVENVANKYGLRTMQFSPETVDEGLAFLQVLFQTMTDTNDTIHRLIVVAAASYDDYLRKNNSLLDSFPNTDLLYFETETPLAGKGSSFYMKYYGAMYEAGAITPVESSEVLLVGANPIVKPIADAMQGYTDGFLASPISVEGQPEKNLVTTWLSDKVSGGFTISDSTAIRLLVTPIPEWEGDRHLLVPICGGSASNFHRIIEMFNMYDFVGIDYAAVSAHCNFSVVKHIDRAVQQCIVQWLSPEGMPKHQTFGLADGYTGVEVHPYTDDSKSRFASLLSNDLQQRIHQEAIRKETEYEK